MSELEWLDRVEQLSSTWKNRCNLVSLTTDRYRFSRMIFEAVWLLNEWDLKILRECLEDNRNWMLIDAHQRLKIEGILRGLWVEECATDERLKNIIIADKDSSSESLKLVTREQFPKVRKILSDLERKDVPILPNFSNTFNSLYDGAHDTAHMSLRLILSSRVERKVWPEIKHCLIHVGTCAIRISRISRDNSHASIIGNEFVEAVNQLDSRIKKVGITPSHFVS